MKPFLLVLFFSLLTACSSFSSLKGDSFDSPAGHLYYTTNGVIPLDNRAPSDAKFYLYFFDHRHFVFGEVTGTKDELIAKLSRATQEGMLTSTSQGNYNYQLNQKWLTGTSYIQRTIDSHRVSLKMIFNGSADSHKMNLAVSTLIQVLGTNRRIQYKESWPLTEIWFNPEVASTSQRPDIGKPSPSELGETKAAFSAGKSSPCQSGGMLAYDINPSVYACHYDHGFTGKDASGWPENLQYAWSRIATVEVCEDKKDLTKTMLPILVAEFGYGELVHDLNGISFHSMQIEKVKNFCTKSRIAEADKALPFFLKGIFPEAWPSNDAWMTDKKPTTGQPSTSK